MSLWIKNKVSQDNLIPCAAQDYYGQPVTGTVLTTAPLYLRIESNNVSASVGKLHCMLMFIFVALKAIDQSLGSSRGLSCWNLPTCDVLARERGGLNNSQWKGMLHPLEGTWIQKHTYYKTYHKNSFSRLLLGTFIAYHIGHAALQLPMDFEWSVLARINCGWTQTCATPSCPRVLNWACLFRSPPFSLWPASPACKRTQQEHRCLHLSACRLCGITLKS